MPVVLLRVSPAVLHSVVIPDCCWSFRPVAARADLRAILPVVTIWTITGLHGFDRGGSASFRGVELARRQQLRPQ